MISAAALAQVKKIPGQVLGNAVKNKFRFIEEEKGAAGLRQVEKKLAAWGVKIRYQDLEDFNWYSESLDILVLLAAQEAFGWNEDKMRQMGRFAAKVSVIAKLMMRYFVSIKRVSQEVGEYWAKYRTAGKLSTEKLDEPGKKMVLLLKDFPGHAVLCRYLEGYFNQIASYVIRSQDLKVQESDCPHRGQDSRSPHRFVITW